MLNSPLKWPLSQSDFERLVSERRPAIFRRAAEDWPCMRLWDPAYLREKVGNRTVTVTRSENALFAVDPEKGHYSPDDMVPLPFSEFLDRISATTDDGPRFYLHKHSVEQQLPELVPDIRVPDHIQGSAMLLTSLWMGPRGSITPIHHDFSDNFFVQARGRKRVVMYEPHPDHAFYRLPFRSVSGRSSWHISRVGSVENPARGNFPLFEQANPIDVIVEQSDVLFIPSFYWHEVHSLDSPSMSLSYWWSKFSIQEIEEMIRSVTRFFELSQAAPKDWRALFARLAREHVHE